MSDKKNLFIGCTFSNFHTLASPDENHPRASLITGDAAFVGCDIKNSLTAFHETPAANYDVVDCDIGGVRTVVDAGDPPKHTGNSDFAGSAFDLKSLRRKSFRKMNISIWDNGVRIQTGPHGVLPTPIAYSVWRALRS